MQQGKHPAGNTPSIQQAHEIPVQGDEWQQKKTKQTKKQEQVPKTAWKAKELQQPEVLIEGNVIEKAGITCIVPTSNTYIDLDTQEQGTVQLETSMQEAKEGMKIQKLQQPKM